MGDGIGQANRVDIEGPFSDPAHVTEVERRVHNVVKDHATRPDPRSERTVTEILEATFRVLKLHGSKKLSVRTVCNEAGISRGTFYRYYESKEDLMASATLFLRDVMDENVARAVSSFSNPADIFHAFMAFTLNNSETTVSSQLFATEPEFVIKYFNENMDHFISRVLRVLDPVFDSWDKKLGTNINRKIISELFVRFALSATVVPTDENMHDITSEIRILARLMRSTSSGAGKT